MNRRDFIKNSSVLASALSVDLPINFVQEEHEFIVWLKDNIVGKRFDIFDNKEKDSFKILPWYKNVLERYDSVFAIHIAKDRQVGASVFNILYLYWLANIKNKKVAMIAACGGYRVHLNKFFAKFNLPTTSRFSIYKELYLSGKVDFLRGTEWDCLYIDEADYILNHKNFVSLLNAKKIIAVSSVQRRRFDEPFYSAFNAVSYITNERFKITMEDAEIMSPGDIDKYKKNEAKYAGFIKEIGIA